MPNDPCQFIDSRDLGEWTIRKAEKAIAKGLRIRPLAVTAWRARTR